TETLAIPVGRFYGTPVLIKSHLWYRNMVQRRYRALLAITDLMADAVLVNSRAVQQDLIQNCGVPVERTYLCYNGVETGEFYPCAGRRVDAVSDASLVIGAACALRSEKRLDLLLDAFARLPRQSQGLRLLIVGSGSMGQ